MKKWVAASAARRVRDARLETLRFMRHAPIARMIQASKMMSAHEMKVNVVRAQGHPEVAHTVAATMLLTGMGYDDDWKPASWNEAAETIVKDFAESLAQTELYMLSPQMCDVVIAAAQTLTIDDLQLVSQDDLPTPNGLLVLPYPLIVRAITGDLGDDRAYQWESPVKVMRPAGETWKKAPAVRISSYHDGRGPVRPDSFIQLERLARQQKTPLPPLLLDAIRCLPFGEQSTEEQRASLDLYFTMARRQGEHIRNLYQDMGYDEERVIGEYTPGTEIHDADSAFTDRFLYAFWRLCHQNTAEITTDKAGHAATLAARKAGVSPEINVVNLRQQSTNPTTTGEQSSPEWQHRWIVRMHKVRQWYPTLGQHKIIYRGPYLKGPADKPLLNRDTVHTLH